MSFLQTRSLVLSLALALLWPATVFAQVPRTLSPKANPPQVQIKTTPAAGYRWHTLVLQHAVPGDILALMHWNQPASSPLPAQVQALPGGVLRIYALKSNNALLIEATDEGFASVVRLVQEFDRVPKQIQFKTLLIAVPAPRASLDAPDTDVDSFLAKLLGGESRVIGTPTVTTTDGVSAAISFSYRPTPVSPSGGWLRLVQAGLMPAGDASSRCEVRLTPRINADGTLTLGLTATPAATPSAVQIMATRTLRGSELVVYDVTGVIEKHGERLFFFLRPTILADGSDADTDGGASITVIP